MMGLTPAGDLLPFEFLDLLSATSRVHRVDCPASQQILLHPSLRSFLPRSCLRSSHAATYSTSSACACARDSIILADPTKARWKPTTRSDRWLRLDPMLVHAAKMDIINAKWRKGEASLHSGGSRFAARSAAARRASARSARATAACARSADAPSGSSAQRACAQRPRAEPAQSQRMEPMLCPLFVC